MLFIFYPHPSAFYWIGTTLFSIRIKTNSIKAPTIELNITIKQINNNNSI